MSWLNLHKKKKLLSDKPCWTFTPPMIHSLKSHALSSCSVVLSISPYLVNFDIVHGYDKYINSLYSNLLLHSRMLHDPKTVIGRDFDQETAEKIAPPFIAWLELANCRQGPYLNLQVGWGTRLDKPCSCLQTAQTLHSLQSFGWSHA